MNDEKKSGEESQGALMEKMLEARTVVISGGVNSDLAQKVTQQLLLLDHLDSTKPITMVINSPGGEVFSGFSIYDMVSFINAPVIGVVSGLAASMGSIIALAPPKGQRYALPNAKFLIHQPLMMGYQGRASDLEIQATEILRDRARIVKLYANNTGKSEEQVAKDIELDNWMTALEAKEYGLVDHIITNRSEIKA